MFWEMQPIASGWGVHAFGLLDLRIEPAKQQSGVATFLMCEALRQLMLAGASLVEVHVPCDNSAALGLFQKLGFNQVDRGVVFRKSIGNVAVTTSSM
jgi:ribosomal protein S18 acetylase RimI-like enzyme